MLLGGCRLGSIYRKRITFSPVRENASATHRINRYNHIQSSTVHAPLSLSVRHYHRFHRLEKRIHLCLPPIPTFETLAIVGGKGALRCTASSPAVTLKIPFGHKNPTCIYHSYLDRNVDLLLHRLKIYLHLQPLSLS